ncbi:hypothetical protein JKF56_08715 [Klebsiella pneumoniae]|uniref:hypothetical protein n=1 Tax=Klebsiella pneumoniae TaxID=573 RepID=UPI001BE44A24|nr:hypothetical protein [Klebsiella pneumoniae]QWA85854.1 hypothetical protein JKF56_08715 [Klebsiella pneumoniae]
MEFLITGFIVAVTALMQNNSSSQYTMRLTVGDSSTIPLAITLGQAAVVNVYYIMTQKGKKKYSLFNIIPSYRLCISRRKYEKCSYWIYFWLYCFFYRQINFSIVRKNFW